ncbi:MAG: hypothetical protein Q3961_05345, partial [Bifidobacteriaceae bacterium]|nr:hypothetical protein [Bifidobacteriaceae bacterium]
MENNNHDNNEIDNEFANIQMEESSQTMQGANESAEETAILHNVAEDTNKTEVNPDIDIMSVSDIDDSEIEQGLQTKTVDNRKRIIIVSAIIAAFFVLMLGYFFGARWYFSDKATYNVMLGDISVTGQNKQELTKTVQNLV